MVFTKMWIWTSVAIPCPRCTEARSPWCNCWSCRTKYQKIKHGGNYWVSSSYRCNSCTYSGGDNILILFLTSILFFVVAAVCIIYAKNTRKRVQSLKKTHAIQEGTITYTDLNIPAKPFFSARQRISGKPDYITKTKNRYIPVEVKTGNHHEPQQHHIFQLAAYCHLLEEHYNDFVPYGILVYYDTAKQFAIPFNPKLRFELESTIKQMRTVLTTGMLKRNHQDAHRCAHCSLRAHCQMNMC